MQANIWASVGCVWGDAQARLVGVDSLWLPLFYFGSVIVYMVVSNITFKAAILKSRALEPGCLGTSSGPSLPCCVSLEKSVNLSESRFLYV